MTPYLPSRPHPTYSTKEEVPAGTVAVIFVDNNCTRRYATIRKPSRPPLDRRAYLPITSRRFYAQSDSHPLLRPRNICSNAHFDSEDGRVLLPSTAPPMNCWGLWPVAACSFDYLLSTPQRLPPRHPYGSQSLAGLLCCMTLFDDDRLETWARHTRVSFSLTSCPWHLVPHRQAYNASRMQSVAPRVLPSHQSIPIPPRRAKQH